MNRIKKAISQVLKEDPRFKQNPLKICFLHHRNKSKIDPEEQIIETIINAGEKALGFKPDPIGALMPSDQSFYINQANVPSVVFGPGSMVQAYQIDEFAKIDDIINGVKFFMLTIYD